jgi:hypothetical protein
MSDTQLAAGVAPTGADNSAASGASSAPATTDPFAALGATPAPAPPPTPKTDDPFAALGATPAPAPTKAAATASPVPPATGFLAGVKRNTVDALTALYHGFNDPATNIRSVQCDDVRATVAVEIAEKKFARMLGHPIQKTPLGLSARRDVPSFSGADEHVIRAVPVEVAYRQVSGRIRRVVSIVPGYMFVRIGCGSHDRSTLRQEKTVVVDGGKPARRAALVDIEMIDLQKRIPGHVVIVAREPALPVARIEATVHINGMSLALVAEDEVVIGVVARRPPWIGGYRVGVLQVEHIPLIKNECALARYRAIRSVVVNEIADHSNRSVAGKFQRLARRLAYTPRRNRWSRDWRYHPTANPFFIRKSRWRNPVLCC